MLHNNMTENNMNKETIMKEFTEKFSVSIESFQTSYEEIEKKYNEDFKLLNELKLNQSDIKKDLNEIQIAIELLNSDIKNEYVDENKKNEEIKKREELKNEQEFLQNKIDQIPILEKSVEINFKYLNSINSNPLYMEGVALKELKEEIKNTQDQKKLTDLIADYNKLKPRFEKHLDKVKIEINSITLERVDKHMDRIDTIAHFQEVMNKIIESTKSLNTSIDTAGDTIRPLGEVLHALPPVRAAVVGIVGIWETGKMWAEKKIEKGVWASKEGNIAWKALKTVIIGGVIATAVVGAVLGTLVTALIAMVTGAVKDFLVFIDAEKKLININKKLSQAETKLKQLETTHNENSNIPVQARVNLIKQDRDKYREKQKEVKKIRNEKAIDFLLTAASVVGVGMLFVFPPVGIAILAATTVVAIGRVVVRNKERIGNFFGRIKNRLFSSEKNISELSEDKKEKIEENEAHIFKVLALATDKKNVSHTKKNDVRKAITMVEGNIETLHTTASPIKKLDQEKSHEEKNEDENKNNEIKLVDEDKNEKEEPPHLDKK